MSGTHRSFSFEPGEEGLQKIQAIAGPEGIVDDHTEVVIGNASDVHPPAPPPHGSSGLPSGQQFKHTPSVRTNATVTPGIDNLGAAAAGGGITGIALGVANSNERESGLEATRGIQQTSGNDRWTGPAERSYNDNTSSASPYVPSTPIRANRDSHGPRRVRDSYASNAPFGVAAMPPGQASPAGSTPPHLTPTNPSQRSLIEPYQSYQSYRNTPSWYDGPYQRQSAYGAALNPMVINAEDIADDGDDDIFRTPQRKSMLPMGFRSNEALPAEMNGTTQGGMRRGQKSTGNGTAYNPVPVSGLEMGYKSEWIKQENRGNRKRAWIVAVVLGFIIIGAIVGGAVGGVYGHRKTDVSSGDD